MNKCWWRVKDCCWSWEFSSGHFLGILDVSDVFCISLLLDIGAEFAPLLFVSSAIFPILKVVADDDEEDLF